MQVKQWHLIKLNLSKVFASVDFSLLLFRNVKAAFLKLLFFRFASNRRRAATFYVPLQSGDPLVGELPSLGREPGSVPVRGQRLPAQSEHREHGECERPTPVRRRHAATTTTTGTSRANSQSGCLPVSRVQASWADPFYLRCTRLQGETSKSDLQCRGKALTPPFVLTPLTGPA